MNIEDFAFCNGVQDGFGIVPSFELWTLTSPLGSLLVGSTYARETIERELSAVCAGVVQA